MKYSLKTLHSSPERARYGVSFVSSKGNMLCRLVKIELYKIFAIINRAIKGLHCMWFLSVCAKPLCTYIHFSHAQLCCICVIYFLMCTVCFFTLSYNNIVLTLNKVYLISSYLTPGVSVLTMSGAIRPSLREIGRVDFFFNIIYHTKKISVSYRDFNQNALKEMRTCHNLHFDKYVSPIGLKINRVLNWPKIHLCTKFGEYMS